MRVWMVVRLASSIVVPLMSDTTGRLVLVVDIRCGVVEGSIATPLLGQTLHVFCIRMLNGRLKVDSLVQQSAVSATAQTPRNDYKDANETEQTSETKDCSG